MADPVDPGFLDVRERGAQELGGLHPHGLRLGADHGQNGPVESGCLVGAERPLGQRGQLDAEERVGVRDRLRHRAGNPLLEQGHGSRPLEAAHGAHEDRQRTGVVAAGVRLERRLDLREEGSETGHRDQRRLQQHERVNVLGVVERQLRGDRPAARVACDVDGSQTEMVEQGRGVGGVVGDAHGRRGVCASDPAALVVPDELVAVGERRFRQ